MPARLSSRLTFANVASSIALFLSLSTGVVYAANEWTGENIVDGSLTGLDIATNSLGTNKIKDENLTALDLAPDSVGSSEIVLNAVGSSEIATDAVKGSEIADNTIDGGELIDNAVTLSDMKGANANGAISFTAGAVGNGRCRHFDITVAGAIKDEVVVISVRATPPEGMIIYGVRIPSNGHATMALCNFTGGAAPAISNLPIHVATFG